MTDSTFLRHEPCPNCGSSDANSRYSDGHTYCFACGRFEKADGESGRRVGGFIAPPVYRGERMAGLIQGEVKALPKRNLTEDTCRHWQYRVGEYNGRPCQIATYCDAEGTPVAQKLRFPDKDFKFIGEPKKAGLYGQHLWRDGGKKVVITEGEIDALSVSQLQSNKWPVVSVPNGAQGAAKSIAKATEWLNKFEQVVFLFDDDEPGREAAKECAALLPPGKAFIARIAGYKDANEALQAHEGAKVIDAIWGAKAYRPDGVVDVASCVDAACAPVQIGVPYPFPTLTEKTYGIRPHELIGIGAGTGIGKTTLFKMLELHLMKQGFHVGVLHLEEPVAHTVKTLAGMACGKRFHVPGVEFDPADLRKAVERFDGKLFMYDHFGATDYDTIKEKIRYMVQSLDCRYVFLDHITALAASIDEDERKAIDKIMADLGALVQQLNCTIFYVSHLTTPEGKSHEEGGRVQERHFRGSRSIAYWTHFMFALERDKQDTEGVITFRVLKDRYTGDAAGLTFGLRYDRNTGLLEECPLEAAGYADETGGGDGEF